MPNKKENKKDPPPPEEDLINPWGLPVDGRTSWGGANIALITMAILNVIPAYPDVYFDYGSEILRYCSDTQFRNYQSLTTRQRLAHVEILRDSLLASAQNCKLNQIKISELKSAQGRLGGKRNPKFMDLISKRETELKELESIHEQCVLEFAQIQAELADLQCDKIDEFESYISIIVLILRAIFRSGVHPTKQTYVMDSETRVKIIEYGMKITEIEDHIPLVQTATYYSFILGEFPMLADHILGCVPSRESDIPEPPGQSDQTTVASERLEREALGALNAMNLQGSDFVDESVEVVASIANTCRACGIYAKKLWKCRCKAVRYCGLECQQADWGYHKSTCTARTPPSARAVEPPIPPPDRTARQGDGSLL